MGKQSNDVKIDKQKILEFKKNNLKPVRTDKMNAFCDFGWYDQVELLEIVEDIILKNKKGFFSVKEVSAKILEIIKNGIIEKEDDATIYQKIYDCFNTEPKKFFCLIPIYGIKINDIYDFSGVSICNIKKKGIILRENISAHILDSVEEHLNLNQNFCTITVTAHFPEEANNIALKQIETIINIFHLIYSSEQRVFNIGIGLTQNTIYTKEFLVMAKNDGKILRPFEYSNIPLDIDEILEKESTILINFLTKMSSFVEKNSQGIELSVLEESMLIAIDFIGQSFDAFDPRTKLINLMSAVESMVEQKSSTQSIADQVCERCAQLLGDKPENKIMIYEKLQKLYDKRSKVSHGGNTIILESEVAFMTTIAKSLIFKFYEKFDEFDFSKNDFNKKFKGYFVEQRFI